MLSVDGNAVSGELKDRWTWPSLASTSSVPQSYRSEEQKVQCEVEIVYQGCADAMSEAGSNCILWRAWRRLVWHIVRVLRLRLTGHAAQVDWKPGHVRRGVLARSAHQMYSF